MAVEGDEPRQPQGVEEGVLAGLYPFRASELPEDRPRVQLFGSGALSPRREPQIQEVVHGAGIHVVAEGADRLLPGRERFGRLRGLADVERQGELPHRRALRVPEDVSLVGFDDLPTSVYALPPLSTVHQPAYELGRLAAAAMLQLLAGNSPAVVLPEPRLIARESSRRLSA